MKKLLFITPCVISVFTIMLYSIFWSRYDIWFFNEDINTYNMSISKPDITISKSSSYYSLNKNYSFSIIFSLNTELNIENFEFLDGYLSIGDHKIILCKNNICIFIDRWHDNIFMIDNFIFINDTKTIYRIIDGKEGFIKFNEPITTNTGNIKGYRLYFRTKEINYNEVKKIINEYNKGIKNTKLKLIFNIKINNEIVTIEINENYYVKIEKYNRFMTHLNN